MEQIIRIGMDTSKHFFQLHGVDATERPVLRKRLGRGQVMAFFCQAAADGNRDRGLRRGALLGADTG